MNGELLFTIFYGLVVVICGLVSYINLRKEFAGYGLYESKQNHKKEGGN